MPTTVPKPLECKSLLSVIIVDALDILFVIVIVENKTNDKDPTLAVIIITITETEITTRIGTEMDALLIAITETVLAVATIPVLGVNLGITIIETEMMITTALTKTLLTDLLLLIIEVLIISFKIRFRHPLLLLITGKYCSIINLSEKLWLLTYMRKLKMLILFKLLPILHLSNVMSLCRTNPIRLLLIVELQLA